MIADTISPPYYAVIFTSLRTESDEDYDFTADRMMALAAEQDGFLGVETARDQVGITVSYWKDEEAIKNWRVNLEHTEAREKGRSHWYQSFRVRIAKVEREYGFERQ